MNLSKQKKGLMHLMAAQTLQSSQSISSTLNVVPSTLHTRMSVKEFVSWINKEDNLEENFNNIEEINTLTYLKTNLKSYDNACSDYNFAFQIRQPLLPVGCASLYLLNQNNETVRVYYKLRYLVKSNNRVSVQSLAEGVYDSMDKNSSLYLDDLSIDGLKNSLDAEMDAESRPIKIPTGNLTIICDILVLRNNGSSAEPQKTNSTYSKSLILYL